MSIEICGVGKRFGNFVAAFAVASLLALLALFTLVAKTLVEWQMRRETEMLDTALPPEKVT